MWPATASTTSSRQGVATICTPIGNPSREVLPRLPGLHRLLSGARVLDVGCGAGNAIVEFASQFPAVQCLGLDVEPVSIRLAQELIAERGLADRVAVRLRENNARSDGLAGALTW